MATTSPHTHDSRVMRAYGAVDRGAQRVLGVDARLLYGFAIPVLVVVGAIVAVTFHARWWLVGLIMALEIAAMVVVVVGFVRMLDQGDQPDELVDE